MVGLCNCKQPLQTADAAVFSCAREQLNSPLSRPTSVKYGDPDTYRNFKELTKTETYKE